MRYLDGALSSRQNNFDLIRLLAAALVIYGHTFTFVANSGARDIIRVLTGFDSGDLAVKSFFFLSGLLVTNSIIEGKSLKKYVVSRLFRIMPALLFMLLIVTFCIGTALTTLPLGDYLVHSDTYRFFVKMSLFGGWGAVGGGYHQLPGVFEASPASGSVNVPLWTLTVEVFSYALILALFALGLLQKRVTLVLALVIIGDSMLGKPVLFYFLPDTLDHRFTPFCFALGGLCAVYKQEVSVSFLMPFGFGLLYVLFRGAVWDDYVFYAAVFSTILAVACAPQVVKLKGDISYGLYLWGWPLQQLVLFMWPGISFAMHLLLSLVSATLMAIVSWKLVERPAMDLARKLLNLSMTRSAAGVPEPAIKKVG
ncbi:acyltransferase family protein [Pseudoduganella sp. R-31]|uniref:acyltransferase family protein n=1 Tax=unclassified Pseudoduganella TaxID=2637179 RepID=UPI003CEC209A